MENWQTKSSKIVYENPWMVVHEDQVIRPDGKDGLYGYVDSKSVGVYIVPVDEAGNTYIIRQERYPIKKAVWECVAGRADGQSIEVAAKRELLEETGLQADSITIMREVQTASGIATFKGAFCLARGLRQVSSELDPEDGILGVQKIPLALIPDKILSGEISDTESIAIFLMAKEHLEKEKAV